jgi:hypothetical protein
VRILLEYQRNVPPGEALALGSGQFRRLQFSSEPQKETDFFRAEIFKAEYTPPLRLKSMKFSNVSRQGEPSLSSGRRC